MKIEISSPMLVESVQTHDDWMAFASPSFRVALRRGKKDKSGEMRPCEGDDNLFYLPLESEEEAYKFAALKGQWLL